MSGALGQTKCAMWDNKVVLNPVFVYTYGSFKNGYRPYFFVTKMLGKQDNFNIKVSVSLILKCRSLWSNYNTDWGCTINHK